MPRNSMSLKAPTKGASTASEPKVLNLKSIMKSALSELNTAALSLGKEPPKVTFSGDKYSFAEGQQAALRNAILTCLAHSIHHGLEPAIVRAYKGKSPRGLISIQIKQEVDSMQIVYLDDGAGLFIDALKVKGIANKKLTKKSTDEEVALTIFDEDMIPLKSSVESLGGNIRLELQEGIEKGFRPVRFVITLPRELDVMQIAG